MVNLDSDGIITRNKSQSGKEHTQPLVFEGFSSKNHNCFLKDCNIKRGILEKRFEVCYSLWVEHDKLFIIIIIIIIIIYIIIIIVIIIIIIIIIILSLLLLLCY